MVPGLDAAALSKFNVVRLYFPTYNSFDISILHVPIHDFFSFSFHMSPCEFVPGTLLDDRMAHTVSLYRIWGESSIN
jgi:hypothetical protein